MTKGWDRIESQEGFAGAEAFAAREVRPVLARISRDPINPDRQKRIIGRFMMAPFMLFGVTFFTLDLFLPDTGFWEFLQFLLFPVLFIGYMAAGLFLMRGRLAKLFVEAQARLALKAEAMNRITAPLGLKYVPAPGGAPKGLEWLSQQSWAPAILREATVSLNAAGGMDEAVAIVRSSGLMVEANTYVVGTPAQKAKYHAQASGMRQIEDGFEGRRAGLDFAMFEWVETVSDAPDIRHLIIVLAAPMPLHGVTHLRARKTSWPQDPNGAPMQDVDLGPKAFDSLYKLRSSDQVEARAIFNPAVIERVIALAHGSPFRAVARAGHLVFDFASEANRFNLVDLITGAWNEETLHQTYADLAEALALVDTLGHAFMLARKSDTSAP
ncbi:DUF3137 domain-containing protein [Hyphomonas sp.]|uniref:DUF3137 domain-containing protein n=1 Tax=Hyphomonas sp. TaxID=87 RepID=UPI0025BF676C|nr:DUF3137 domain-containing protein [Hyphomonas sp.]